MGNLLEVLCPCGYRASGLAEGGLLGGKVAAVFACHDCGELSSALVYSVEQEPVPNCQHCRSEDVERWDLPDSRPPRGNCPRCARPLEALVVGIAD